VGDHRGVPVCFVGNRLARRVRRRWGDLTLDVEIKTVHTGVAPWPTAHRKSELANAPRPKKEKEKDK